MLRFIVIFLVSLLALFTLELQKPVYDNVILPFTGSLAHVAVWIMQLFDHVVVAQDNTIRQGFNGNGIAIEPGCNGVEAVLILVSAVFAFPAPWKYKLAGIGIGFLAIQALNMVRIISLYYLLLWNRVWFDWFHLYLWQALILLDALVFWLVWLRWLPRDPSPPRPPSSPLAATA
jgi:exosortase H (IPTLxxWG-CTERM-specific)